MNKENNESNARDQGKKQTKMDEKVLASLRMRSFGHNMSDVVRVLFDTIESIKHDKVNLQRFRLNADRDSIRNSFRCG